MRLCVVVPDGLFGNCQKAGRLLPDGYQYQLTGAQRHQLEKILTTLIQSGYAWSHRYTQCVIANVLLAYRSGVDVDLGFCAAAGQFPSAPSARWTAGGDRYDQQAVPSWLSGGRSPFDGFPLPEIRPDSLRSPPTAAALDEDYLDDADAVGRRVNAVEDFLRGLSTDDLDALKKYVVDEDLTQRVGELPPEPAEQTDVVRRLHEQDPDSNDDDASEY